jgi:hypothetical protein
MPDAQIAIIEQQDTQAILVVPGIQGPAGVSSYSTISGTSYTLNETDRSKILVFTASGATTLTVPSGLSGLFDAMFVQAGAGQVTVSGASGVTINAALSATKTAYQYAVASLLPIAPNVFILSGEVTA